MSSNEIRIPAHYKPRPEQLAFWNAYHSGVRFFDLCWHRREGKDLTALNATVEEILTKRPGLAWHLFPTLAQGRKVLWDATDNEGRPLTSAFPKQLITEINKADMRIKCKFVPDMVEGREVVRESTWQVVGADNPDSLRGANPILVVISEFGDIAPSLWYEIIQPILVANGGKAMFVWTPKGRNHAYTLHCAAQESMNNPDEKPEYKWFSQVLTVADTHKWVDASGAEVGIPSEELIATGSVRCLPVVPEEAVQKAREQGMDENKLLQEFYCLPPNALVATVSGQKEIKDVKVNDYVLTHRNFYEPVTCLHKRRFHGNLVKITNWGNNTPLLITPNHPVRVFDYSSQKFEWKPAGKLSTDDWVTLPRNDRSKTSYGNKALATIIAWYLSDGSVTHNAVEFTIGHTEDANEETLRNAAKELGYDLRSYKDKTNATVKKLFIYSRHLKDKLIKWCGRGSANKHIPFDIIDGAEETFLTELLKGDGYVVNTDKTVFSSVSVSLAYDVQRLAIMLGYKSSVNKYSAPAKASIIDGREIKNNYDIYRVSVVKNVPLPATSALRIGLGKYCQYMRVRSVERVPYNGLVYNISVLNDESYVAEGRVVHNCSFDAALKGAYFGDQMNEAVRDGRINNMVLHDPAYPVYTGWDLGMNDTTDIVFAQIIDSRINIIDFYENNGKGLEHYIQYCQNKPYTYAMHFGPHDLRVRELGAGSRLEFARKLGMNFTVIPRVSNKEDSINAARAILNRCFFHMTKCHDLIEALKCYTKKWDEKRQVYLNTPLHDKNSNSSDAFQTLCMGLNTNPKSMKRMQLKRTEDGYLLEKPTYTEAYDKYDIFSYNRD